MNITGRLTKDAKVSTLSDSRQVVNFSVAINESYKNKKGDKVEQTTFFDCAYWVSPRVAEWLTKGTVVELTGMVSARAWTGNDGEPRAGLNFNTSNIKLHGGGKKSESGQEVKTGQNAEQGSKKATIKEPEDDIPF
ncbi:single-stranded DNA-binding protein [Flavobacterium hibernum]|uniref:Single-stranded DNA-binding protein n=1 Tax=Flavobacterium hibernum TaxID=37752 RepID=A0A0D0EE76_9FLAO|nr:single-stranded DNA-binding protein [Flavobacterium hibernum]KIO51869.1 single-stranded DNA-binding protein [Flavobacterium hibernum]OXA84254.1 single-stranded DNA-binding protein [Flavobacterium hibernum]STO18951.1 Helix-destabilizing protein [Flavobacterium hibernum]